MHRLLEWTLREVCRSSPLSASAREQNKAWSKTSCGAAPGEVKSPWKSQTYQIVFAKLWMCNQLDSDWIGYLDYPTFSPETKAS